MTPGESPPLRAEPVTLNLLDSEYEELTGRLQDAELKIRVLEERLRLVRIAKYGPGSEKLSDAQLDLLELEPGGSNVEAQAESERPAVQGTAKRTRNRPGRQQPPRSAGIRVLVIRGDMRTFGLPEPVDLVTCAYDALNDVPQKSDLARTARAVARALRPGGYFYFDVNNRKHLQKNWPGTHWSAEPGVVLVMVGRYDRRRAEGCLDRMVHTRKGSQAAISRACRETVVDSWRDSPSFAWGRLRACPKLGREALLPRTTTLVGLSNLLPSTIGAAREAIISSQS